MAKKKSRSRSSKAQQDELVFKALANKDRRQILDLLRDAHRNTGELCESLPHLNRCTVMQHLGKLEKANLILVKREGKYRWNYLNVEPIQRIYNRWIKDFAQPAAELLVHLKDELEKG